MSDRHYDPQRSFRAPEPVWTALDRRAAEDRTTQKEVLLAALDTYLQHPVPLDLGALAQAVFADVDLTAAAVIYGQARTAGLDLFARHVSVLAAAAALRSVAEQYGTAPVPAAELRRAAESFDGRRNARDEDEPEASGGPR
jgi:hypothetical protein